MTRKDYIALAAALAATRPDVEDYTRHSAIGDNTMVDGISFKAAGNAWSRARSAVADTLAADNYRFNRARFLAATER